MPEGANLRPHRVTGCGVAVSCQQQGGAARQRRRPGPRSPCAAQLPGLVAPAMCAASAPCVPRTNMYKRLNCDCMVHLITLWEIKMRRQRRESVHHPEGHAECPALLHDRLGVDRRAGNAGRTGARRAQQRQPHQGYTSRARTMTRMFSRGRRHAARRTQSLVCKWGCRLTLRMRCHKERASLSTCRPLRCRCHRT
jgi:hypothetical protein